MLCHLQAGLLLLLPLNFDWPAAGSAVATLLLPQGFNNVDAQSDIFNKPEPVLLGVHVAWNRCPGIHCLHRHQLRACGASPWQTVAWFPTFTITEDYALGMMLKAKGYKGRLPQRVPGHWRGA